MLRNPARYSKLLVSRFKILAKCSRDNFLMFSPFSPPIIFVATLGSIFHFWRFILSNSDVSTIRCGNKKSYNGRTKQWVEKPEYLDSFADCLMPLKSELHGGHQNDWYFMILEPWKFISTVLSRVHVFCWRKPKVCFLVRRWRTIKWRETGAFHFYRSQYQHRRFVNEKTFYWIKLKFLCKQWLMTSQDDSCKHYCGESELLKVMEQ